MPVQRVECPDGVLHRAGVNDIVVVSIRERSKVADDERLRFHAGKIVELNAEQLRDSARSHKSRGEDRFLIVDACSSVVVRAGQDRNSHLETSSFETLGPTLVALKAREFPYK